MMKAFLIGSLLLGAAIGSANASDPEIIRISTNETDLILQVAPNGRLYQSYLGDKLRYEDDLKSLAWNVKAATDGSVTTRGWEVYPASGWEDYFEPALATEASRHVAGKCIPPLAGKTISSRP